MNKQYFEAIESLDSVKDSKYLAKGERKQITKSLSDIKKSLEIYGDEMRGLFDVSAELYAAGEIDEARLGFEEVNLSGIEIISDEGFDASDYIMMIDHPEVIETPVGVEVVEVFPIDIADELLAVEGVGGQIGVGVVSSSGDNGKAPELSDTQRARMPAFFEHSNVNLPQYA